MEVVAYGLGIMAFVFAAAAALLGVIHHRDATIWTTCMAIVLAVIGGFCWLQDREWKKDALAWSDAPEKENAPRPYVWIKHVGLIGFAPEVNPTAEVIFENAGNTPAFDVSIETVMRITLGQLTSDPPRLKIETPPVRIALPVGGTAAQTVTTGTPTNAEEIDAILKRSHFLYVHGILTYRSQSKKTYKQRFCMFYNTINSTFEVSPFHNDAE